MIIANFDLEKYKLEDLSDIHHQIFSISRKSGSEYSKLFIVRFSGHYGWGSGGNSQGNFMKAIVQAVKAAANPSLMVLDLSELHYEWGDMLIHPIREACIWGYNCPVVISDLNSQGLSTLLPMVTTFVELHEWMFYSLEEAIAAAEKNYALVNEARDFLSIENCKEDDYQKISCQWDKNNADSNARFRREVIRVICRELEFRPICLQLLCSIFRKEAGWIARTFPGKTRSRHLYGALRHFEQLGKKLLNTGEINAIDTFLFGITASKVIYDNLFFDLRYFPRNLLDKILTEITSRQNQGDLYEKGFIFFKKHMENLK